MRTRPDKSAKLFLSRNATAHGVEQRPVHTWVGLFSSVGAPVSCTSLLVVPYNLSSRFGLAIDSGVTGCSPPAGVCFHSSRKKSGARLRAGARAAGVALGAFPCCAKTQTAPEKTNATATVICLDIVNSCFERVVLHASIAIRSLELTAFTAWARGSVEDSAGCRERRKAS